MKKLIFLILLLPTLCFAWTVQDAHKAVIGRMGVEEACTPLTDSFITNPSMEDDSADWADSGTVTTNEQSASQDNTGGGCQYSRHIVTSNQWAGVQQYPLDASPTNGVTYDVTCYVYPVSGVVKFYDTAGNCDITNSTSTSGTGSWESITGSCTGNGSAEGIKIITSSADGAEFYVDDCTWVAR